MNPQHINIIFYSLLCNITSCNQSWWTLICFLIAALAFSVFSLTRLICCHFPYSLLPFLFCFFFQIRTSLLCRAQLLFEKGQMSFIALQSWEINKYVELFLQGLRKKLQSGDEPVYLEKIKLSIFIHDLVYLQAPLSEFPSHSPTLF